MNLAVPRTQNPLWLRGVRIWPRATVRWRLPSAGKATLRAVLGLDLDQNSCGGARVRVLAAGRVLFDETLSPGSEWKTLSLDLPAGGELAVEAGFVAPARFPCSVLLGDPFLCLIPRPASRVPD